MKKNLELNHPYVVDMPLTNKIIQNSNDELNFDFI